MEIQQVGLVFRMLLTWEAEGTRINNLMGSEGRDWRPRVYKRESPDDHLLLWVGILKVYTQGIRVDYKQTDPHRDCSSASDNFGSRNWTEVILSELFPRTCEKQT